MTQYAHGSIDPNTKSGTALASDLTQKEQALLTSNSGATRPTYAVAGTVWLNTAATPNNVLTLFDGTRDIPFATFNFTTGKVSITLPGIKGAQKTPPGAPATGDAYLVTATATGAWVGQEGKQATWDGSAWQFTNAPANSTIVDDNGVLRVTNSAGVVSSPRLTDLNGGPLGGYRNKVINGDFDIWQRGNGPFTTNGAYTADRWKQIMNNASVQKVTDALPIQTQTTGALEISGTGRYGSIEQRLEDKSLIGKIVTLTFWARVTSGTYTMTSRFNTYNNTFTAAGNSPNMVANLTTTWQKFTFLQAFPATYTDGVPTIVLDDRPSGSPTSATIRIKHVSLVVGDARQEDDPFSPRHIQQEIALCQRYFVSTLTGGSSDVESGGLAITAARLAAPVAFPIPMRVLPSVSIFSPANETPGAVALYNLKSTDLGTSTVPNSTRPGGFQTVIGASGLTVNNFYTFRYTADAEL